jgi:orotate phosphoribosyltransferase
VLAGVGLASLPGVFVLNRTNSLGDLKIKESFQLAPPKHSEYYSGAGKTAVPQTAQIAKSGNSKLLHHSENLKAVSGPSLLGIPLMTVCPAMRKGGSCAQTA